MGTGCMAVLLWRARGWGSRAECPVSRCGCSGCSCFCLCQDCAAITRCAARVSAHPIPLPTWLAGRGMLWLGSPPATGAELEESLDFCIPPMPCPFGPVSCLLTWHHCRPVLLGASLGLVPRKKHFQQPWWPLPQSSYWTVLRGLLTYPQVSRGKVNVLLYFWCWTGGIRHPITMITSVFVSID